MRYVIILLLLSVVVLSGCQQADVVTIDSGACTDRYSVCTEEYDPVCGWFSEDIKCIKYPCAMTYSNDCVACSDSKVKYWTKGECPDDVNSPQKLCENIGGTYISLVNECVGIDVDECNAIGGSFDECASACRNYPDSEVCTLQCVPICML